MSKDPDPGSLPSLGKRPYTVLIDYLVYDVPLAEVVKRGVVLSQFQVLLISGEHWRDFLSTCRLLSTDLPYSPDSCCT